MAGIRLEIVTPERMLVRDDVDEVVVPGEDGYLGVLPGHTPLLSTLRSGDLWYRKGQEKTHVTIGGGFAEVLPDRVAKLLKPLRELVTALTIRARIPQIEVAYGEDATLVLVLRNLDPLSEADEQLLERFASTHSVYLYLQPQGPKSIHPLSPQHVARLSYTLPEFDIVMPFNAAEFTQVNPQINRVLVRRAVELLAPQPNERVLDLFCGLGNFSLPLARRGAQVHGIEGEQTLVQRARKNAELNGLGQQTSFERRNLFNVDQAALASLGQFDKWLIDPPRDGAIEVVKSLPEDAPRSIVYISCNPATLARDASVLVHSHRYRLRCAGIMNMFPHTSHVESIALFERGGE